MDLVHPNFGLQRYDKGLKSHKLPVNFCVKVEIGAILQLYQAL
jgi:hypothetical protein